MSLIAPEPRSGEDVHALPQPLKDLGGLHRARLRGSQLQRERHAVEPAAEHGDGLQLIAGDRGAGIAGPLEEEAHGVVVQVGGVRSGYAQGTEHHE